MGFAFQNVSRDCAAVGFRSIQETRATPKMNLALR
jgi:hypothetical protein